MANRALPIEYGQGHDGEDDPQAPGPGAAALPPGDGNRLRLIGQLGTLRQRRFADGGDRVSSDAEYAHGTGDVLDVLLAEIGERQIELVTHLVARGARHGDAAGLADRFEAGRDIDAVPEYVVSVDDDVADIDANAQQERRSLGGWRAAPAQVALDADGAGDRVDRARELGEQAVAGGLDDASPVAGYSRIDAVGPQGLEGAQRADLVFSHEAAVADHVGGQDRREPALGGHRVQCSFRSIIAMVAQIIDGSTRSGGVWPSTKVLMLTMTRSPMSTRPSLVAEPICGSSVTLPAL